MSSKNAARVLEDVDQARVRARRENDNAFTFDMRGDIALVQDKRVRLPVNAILRERDMR